MVFSGLLWWIRDQITESGDQHPVPKLQTPSHLVTIPKALPLFAFSSLPSLLDKFVIVTTLTDTSLQVEANLPLDLPSFLSTSSMFLLDSHHYLNSTAPKPTSSPSGSGPTLAPVKVASRTYLNQHHYLKHLPNLSPLTPPFLLPPK